MRDEGIHSIAFAKKVWAVLMIVGILFHLCWFVVIVLAAFVQMAP